MTGKAVDEINKKTEAPLEKELGICRVIAIGIGKKSITDRHPRGGFSVLSQNIYRNFCKGLKSNSSLQTLNIIRQVTRSQI